MPASKDIEQSCLKNFLIRCNFWYYVKAAPILSDYEFDMEFKRLQKLEEVTGVVDSNSPTLTPGSDSEGTYPDWAKEDLTVTVQEAKMQVVDDGSY